MASFHALAWAVQSEIAAFAVEEVDRSFIAPLNDMQPHAVDVDTCAAAYVASLITIEPGTFSLAPFPYIADSASECCTDPLPNSAHPRSDLPPPSR